MRVRARDRPTPNFYPHFYLSGFYARALTRCTRFFTAVRFVAALVDFARLVLTVGETIDFKALLSLLPRETFFTLGFVTVFRAALLAFFFTAFFTVFFTAAGLVGIGATVVVTGVTGATGAAAGRAGTGGRGSGVAA